MRGTLVLRRDTVFGPTIEVGGIPFVATSFDAAVERVLDLAVSSTALPVRFGNAYCIAIADQDERYRDLHGASGITFPDGAPVRWTMRRLARRVGLAPGRVELIRGPSFFLAALERSRDLSIRHYFLGSSPQTIEQLVETVRATFPGVQVAGAHSPEFGPVDDEFVDDAARRVALSGANMLWIALGTPKQDYAATLLADRLGIPAAAVGAAFDFTAGTVRQAPGYLRGTGLEWAYRLTQDPRRLWRRYSSGNLTFMGVALKALLQP